MGKKVLVILLALMMSFTLLPFSVLAEDPPAEEPAAELSFDVLRTVINPGLYYSGAIIDMGTSLNAGAVDKDTFTAKARVTEHNGTVQGSFGSFAWDPEKADYALGEGWAKWNILDAYVCDAAGNRAASGQYVKLDIEWGTRTERNGNSANRYDVPATRAIWYTGGTAGNLIAYASAEVKIDQAKAIAGIGDVVYVQGATRHDPVAAKFEMTEAFGYQYSLYRPDNASESNKRPLFIWFHGTGERFHGTNIGGNLYGNRAAAFADTEFQAAMGGAYVLAPQSNQGGWSAAALNDIESLINKVVAENNVDPDRIIVGGLSMGTGMTMPLIYSTTANRIEFAAAILCSGGSVSASQAALLTQRGISLYLVGAVSDGAAGSQPAAYNNLVAAGGDARIFRNPAGPTFDGQYYYGAHDTWNYIYNNLVVDDKGETLFQWAAKQIRAEEGVVNFTLDGSNAAVVGENAEYVLSAANMSKVATLTAWFEVDGKYFSGKAVEGLNGFEVLGDIVWESKGGSMWSGRVTIANYTGGVSVSTFTDILKLTLATKEELGASAVKITRIDVSGYDGSNIAIFYEGDMGNDTVNTEVLAYFSPYDINRDGVVDQLDLTTAQLYYAAREGDANWDVAKIADVNGDGRVDIEDLILILNHIVW